MIAPTARQLEFLQFIHQHVTDRGYAPSIREMMGSLGVNSTNGVTDHLDALERKGLITRARKASRAISLTDQGRRILARGTDGPGAWEPSQDGVMTRRIGETLVEYAAPPSGARWRVGSGPWWMLGHDVGREELEASLAMLRRLGVVS